MAVRPPQFVTDPNSGGHFSIEAVDRRRPPASSHTTTCPWKGLPSYYDVVVDGEVNRNAAWYYPEPSAAGREVTNRVAFWNAVKVAVAQYQA